MSTPNFEIHNLLVLSTSHILQEDADLIAGEVFPGKGGDEVSLLVYCGEPGDGSFAEETAQAAHYSGAFLQALALARRLGCRYLLFDNAGPTVDELPTFDW
jgi:hypothetical protein